MIDIYDEYLERSYLRITSGSNPLPIRSLPILQKALKHILTRWEAGEINYNYLDEQLRCIK